VQAIDESIATVRKLSCLLHPPLLDEAGLQAALYWFVEGPCETVRSQNFHRSHTAKLFLALKRC
jgi:signal transduction histidine kinase